MIAGIVTAILLLSFLGGSAWATARAAAEFEAAARCRSRRTRREQRLVVVGDR
jgi:hypothetical protein